MITKFFGNKIKELASPKIEIKPSISEIGHGDRFTILTNVHFPFTGKVSFVAARARQATRRIYIMQARQQAACEREVVHHFDDGYKPPMKQLLTSTQRHTADLPQSSHQLVLLGGIVTLFVSSASCLLPRTLLE